MGLILKASTALTLKLGPFLDPSDGVTPVTGLAGTMDVKISKLGAAFATRNDATAITHDTAGFYNVVLNATDTNTPGRLFLMVSDAANHLPVWADYMVAYADPWEALFGGTALPVNVTSVGSSGSSATNLRDFFNATGYNAAASTVGTVTTVGTTGQNAIRDAIAAKVIESQGSYTLQQALSIILAAVAGVTDDSGATIKTPNGSATRIAATLSSNERTAMTLTPSS